jgi:hypothetical protein
MGKPCWSCAEPYDDYWVTCPQCGALKEKPKIVEPEPEPEPVKRSHKAKTPGRK